MTGPLILYDRHLDISERCSHGKPLDGRYDRIIPDSSRPKGWLCGIRSLSTSRGIFRLRPIFSIIETKFYTEHCGMPTLHDESHSGLVSKTGHIQSVKMASSAGKLKSPGKTLMELFQRTTELHWTRAVSCQ